jgi:hypothetical protein
LGYILLFGIIRDFGPNIYIKRKLKFKTCKSEYEFYLFGQHKLYEGHFIDNNFTKHNALVELAECLIELYKIQQDKEIENKLIELAKSCNPNINYEQLNFEYIWTHRYEIFCLYYII